MVLENSYHFIIFPYVFKFLDLLISLLHTF